MPHGPFEPLNVLACPGVARLPGHVAATNRAAILRQSRATWSLNPTSPKMPRPQFRFRTQERSLLFVPFYTSRLAVACPFSFQFMGAAIFRKYP